MNAINDPATTQAAQWLAQSELTGAAALFGDECYWRGQMGACIM